MQHQIQLRSCTMGPPQKKTLRTLLLQSRIAQYQQGWTHIATLFCTTLHAIWHEMLHCVSQSQAVDINFRMQKVK